MDKKAVFLLIILTIISASAQEIKTYVNDYAGLLNKNEISQISSIAEEIFNSGNAQYAILIVNTTNGKSIQEYGLEIAQGKLGDTEKKNGLLLVVAVSDRQYFFEVGSGLEGTLNDAKVGRIGRNYLVPNFRNSEYGKGIIEASNALKSILVNGTDPTTASSSAEKNLTQGQINFIIAFSIFFILIIALSIQRELKRKNRKFDAAEGAIIIFGGGRGGFGGSGSSGGFGGGGFSGGGGGGGW